MKQQIKVDSTLKILVILGFLVQTAFAQQRIAILNTEDDGDPPLKPMELSYLTDRLREIAGNVLKDRYGIMTQESIVNKLGSKENAAKECKAASCLADLGRKLSANYIAQGRVGRFGKDFTIKVELYNSASGLQASPTITGNSKDVFGLLAALDEKTPGMFREMLPKELQAATASTVFPAAPAKSSVSIEPSKKGNTFTDTRDGKIYKMVKIGEQVWMAENLNYNASGSKCYDNRAKNCDRYGRLYDWETAMKACPSGWDLPSDAEWNTLTSFVGSPAAKKLKFTSGWNNLDNGESGNGTDDFGFAALPGGHGDSNGNFHDGANGYWWSTTEYHASVAWSRLLRAGDANMGRYDGSKTYLFSVRCIRD
ncbi:MAG: fibrobacter succinogenes major paralogous domain-containing protein [Fibromonadaceae bacterium]|jgi:uncharacterized protein (TIGR02145 family)|nr:fibrobacter succinogenes major paralogous domain-containing protein [Fibromonadaceae bacterium]